MDKEGLDKAWETIWSISSGFLCCILVRWTELTENATTDFDEEEGRPTSSSRGYRRRTAMQRTTEFLAAVDAYRLWLREMLDKRI